MSVLICSLHLKHLSSASSVSEYSTMCKGKKDVEIKLQPFLAPSFSAEVNGLFYRPTPFPCEITADFIVRIHILEVLNLYRNNTF